MSKETKRFLSGIQPTGEPHLGNYFGAIKQHIENQFGANSLYFIANYHSLTTINDKEKLKNLTKEVAVTYLACGLDPNNSTLFRQSDVPELTELTWLLLTVTPMGLLQKAVSYKDKIAKGMTPNAGLFTYPVLMSSDILAYDSTTVPVGKDQIQHIEITRDIAQRFNNIYGETFVVPNYKLSSTPLVPGIDGAKMSKSYGNGIFVFDEGKTLKKKVMSIVTSSKPLEAPKDPDTCNIFSIYKLVASEEKINEMAENYRAGNYGFGHAKKALLDEINEYFEPFREKRKELLKSPDYIEDVLIEGGKKARVIARETLNRALEATGLK
ncbi:MAG: tryptophan--tRNA ligase [Calditrichaeota bacterium]|nr:MAG: tryptophan--tRNA ligase [Calditrichota bacterium]